MGWLAFGIGLALALAAHGAQPPCSMNPAQVAMQVPEKGFVWLKDQGLPEDCGAPPSGRWTRESAGPLALYVHADGPSGSARFWRVTVAIADAGEPAPSRGFCLETSTVGWRTLRHFRRSPLPWLLDLDADRKPELILWDSFPITKSATAAQYGLVAWVYEFNPPGSFSLDMNASRALAREHAAEYRSAAESGAIAPGALRKGAAQALEAFADARCATRAVPPKSRR